MCVTDSEIGVGGALRVVALGAKISKFSPMYSATIAKVALDSL